MRGLLCVLCVVSAGSAYLRVRGESACLRPRLGLGKGEGVANGHA
jgi:hypothetical protein